MSQRRPHGRRRATRAPKTRTYNQRSGAEVSLLIILALVSLLVALGLYAWGRVEDLAPELEERQRHLEEVAGQHR